MTQLRLLIARPNPLFVEDFAPTGTDDILSRVGIATGGGAPIARQARPLAWAAIVA